MALHVVEKACQFSPDRSRAVITIESDVGGPQFQAAFHELDSQDARHLAQSYAGQAGMGTAFINGNLSSPYPVNSEGLSLENVRDDKGQPLPQTHPRMQPARYRIDVPLSRPLR